MITFHIQATVFYNHRESEIADLAEAIEPMYDYILAVASNSERAKLFAILNSDHFRARDVALVVGMLLRAAKYARHHLGEYFPQMQAGVIAQAENLEDAARRYSKMFKTLQNETIVAN